MRRETLYTVAPSQSPPVEMIRPLRALLAIAFLAGGAALGALNPTVVRVDFGIVRFDAALGVVMLGALLIGVLLGGAALTVSVILPMRHRFARERKSAERGDGATARTADLEDAAHGLHQ